MHHTSSEHTRLKSACACSSASPRAIPAETSSATLPSIFKQCKSASKNFEEIQRKFPEFFIFGGTRLSKSKRRGRMQGSKRRRHDDDAVVARRPLPLDLVRLVLVNLDMRTCFRSRRVCQLWKRLVDEMTFARPLWAAPVFPRWYKEVVRRSWPPASLSNVELAVTMNISSVTCACGAPIYIHACACCLLAPCECDWPRPSPASDCADPTCAWLSALCKQQAWCNCTWGRPFCLTERHAWDYIKLKRL